MDQAFWDQLAEAIADKVLDRLRGGGHGWFDQSVSPLGRRRHIQAVRKRVAAGAGGAAIVDRRHLLSREALAVELEGHGSKVESDDDADLRRELRLVGGG